MRHDPVSSSAVCCSHSDVLLSAGSRSFLTLSPALFTMQSTKRSAKFFSEDLIYKSGRDGKSQVGLVIGSCDSDSDEEESDSSSHNGRCKIAAGQAKVAWYPTGKTQVIDENKVSLVPIE